MTRLGQAIHHVEATLSYYRRSAPDHKTIGSVFFPLAGDLLSFRPDGLDFAPRSCSAPAAESRPQLKIDLLRGVVIKPHEGGINATKGAGIAAARIGTTPKLADQEADDLARVAAGQGAVDLGVVLARIAHEQK